MLICSCSSILLFIFYLLCDVVCYYYLLCDVVGSDYTIQLLQTEPTSEPVVVVEPAAPDEEPAHKEKDDDEGEEEEESSEELHNQPEQVGISC